VVRRSGRSRVIRVDAVNFYTDAGQRAAHAPSLCPGDSGGPVLHQGRVVGVHTVVFGLNRRHGARSNMAVNLAPLADWSAWP
jgi:S1-C subfamily serine protease